MTLFKSEKLTYQQTVLQHQEHYYAILSIAFGFDLDHPDTFLTEQTLLKLWNSISNGLPLDEGYAKLKAEVMLIGITPLPAAMRLCMTDLDKEIQIYPLHKKDTNIQTSFLPIAMRGLRRWQYFKDHPQYWQNQGLPILPDDIDFKFFQQALSDQQRQAYFQAGESYQVHIDQQILMGRLPTFKLRLFLANSKFASGFSKAIELPLQQDTLYLLPEQRAGILIARACIEVQNIHMQDWEHKLILVEPADQPLLLTECEAIFKAYLENAALLKPSETKLIQKSAAIEAYHQKNQAEQIFQMMEQAFSKIKPSLVLSQQSRFQGHAASLLRIKNSTFTQYDFKDFELNEAVICNQYFQNCTFNSVSFNGVSFKNCTFKHCAFNKISFYQSQFYNIDFIDCEIKDSDFRSGELNGCRIINSHLQKIKFECLKAYDTYWTDTYLNYISAQLSLWHNIHITGGTWKKIDFKKAKFNAFRVQNLQLKQVDFTETIGQNMMLNGKKMAFIQCHFCHAQWQAPNFLQSYWYRTELENTEMPNAEWSQAKIVRSHWLYVSSLESRFLDTLFLGTRIESVNFNQAILEGAVFQHCSSENNQFEKVNLNHVTGM